MAKNPNFKRLTRINSIDDQRKSIIEQNKHTLRLAQKMDDEKKQKIQAEKEYRWNTKGTLGQITDKYIHEGLSDNEAFKYAKQDLNL